MKIENQVSNLELSRKLKDLGVKQESLFYWWGKYTKYTYPKKRKQRYDLFQLGKIEGKRKIKRHKKYPESISDAYSAFTVAELGEMLPPFWRFTERSETTWWIPPQNKIKHFKADTEANARAKMLIYLLENKLLPLNNKSPNK